MSEVSKKGIDNFFDPDKRVELFDKEKSNYEDKTKSFDPDTRIHAFDKLESVNELVKEYIDDLKGRTLFFDTINFDKVKTETIERISPEKVKELREEFSDIKNNLIKQWEDINGIEWPRYKDYVYNENGVVIRKPGDRYDAHHILSLCFGGKNEVSNITPMHCNEHYDSKGIHRNDGPWAKIRDRIGGQN